MKMFITEDENRWNRKLNFVDENNVVLGYDYTGS